MNGIEYLKPLYVFAVVVGLLVVAYRMGRLAGRNDGARDRTRYQWLRSRDIGTCYRGGVFVGKTPDNLVLNGAEMDAAIDQAMALEGT